jgi:hypothetical protein
MKEPPRKQTRWSCFGMRVKTLFFFAGRTPKVSKPFSALLDRLLARNINSRSVVPLQQARTDLGCVKQRRLGEGALLDEVLLDARHGTIIHVSVDALRAAAGKARQGG